MTNTETLQITTPSDREVVLTRVFNAPRHLVFDAMMTPKLLERWLIANGRPMTVTIKLSSSQVSLLPMPRW